MRILILLCIIALSTTNAFAANNSQSGFRGMAALTGGVGKTKNKSESIPEADMLYGEASLNLGYRFGILVPLTQATYRSIGQRTDPDKVNGINTAGAGYTYGAGLEMTYMRVSLSAVYRLGGKYDLKKESAGGTKVSYDKLSGFHVNLGYQYAAPWKVLLNFSQIKYDQRTSGTSKSDIKEDPLSQTLFGAGVGYMF